MNKIVYLPIIFLSFTFITTSCRTKSSSDEIRENNSSVNTPIINNQGTTQSVPETSVPSQLPQESEQAPQVESNNEIPKEEPKKVIPKRTPLGSYKTPLLNKTKNRVHNIKLAAKRINGYQLRSGATFSFNDVIGKRDAENGFKVATVIVKRGYGRWSLSIEQHFI
jgi:vancomycin resistance protein YoaR